MASLTQKQAKSKRLPPGEMVSLTEAARRLGVSPRTVDRYLAAGLIKYGVYPGGRRMVDAASVEQFRQDALAGRL